MSDAVMAAQQRVHDAIAAATASQTEHAQAIAQAQAELAALLRQS